jgi:uronate dehydrogenase
MKKILITGAAGQIGRVLRDAWQGKYALRLSDIAPLSPARAGEECIAADLSDPAAVDALMRGGIHTVAHFGGHSVEGTWQQLLGPNIVGVYNVLESARHHGVQRVVLASSNHAIGFYRRAVTLDVHRAPRPDGLYGVTKAFCENIGSMYAYKHGLTVACLRIGTFKFPDRPDNVRHLSTWISHRDMVHLIERCIEAPDYRYVLAYGVSNNTRRFWDNAGASALGYQPVDDAEQWAAEILARDDDEDPLAKPFHGGPYVPPGFTGNEGDIP